MKGLPKPFFDKALGLWTAKAATAPGRYKSFRGPTAQAATNARDSYVRSGDWALDRKRAAATKPTQGPEAYIVGDVVTMWLGHQQAKGCRTNTLATNDWEVATLHKLCPVLCGLTLGALTRAAIEAEYARLVRDGVPTRTRQGVHAALRGGVNYALDRDWLPTSPMAKVAKPKGPRPVGKEGSVRAWSQAEAQTWLDKARRGYADLGRFLLRTGLRPGEAYALRVRDVGPGWVQVRETMTWRPGMTAPTFGPVKTKAGLRRVPVDSATMALLEERTATEHRDSLVWRDRLGGPCNPRSVNRALQTEAATLGLPQRTVHEYRHTHATLLIAAGCPVKVVSERLGHSDIGVTLEKYTHVLPGMGQLALDTMAKVFAPVPCGHGVSVGPCRWCEASEVNPAS